MPAARARTATSSRRVAGAADEGRVPAGPEEEDAGVRALLHGRGRRGLRRPAARRARLRREVLHEEGNFDLVGNNIPVFFIQDAIKFPDLIHSVKMEPDRGFPQAASAHDTFWDFVSLMPESMHMLMWAMSDRAIPRSLPHDGGLRRAHVPPGQREGRVDVREVPLAARSSGGVGRLGRGREDQRRRSRLPPARSVRGDRDGRFPRVRVLRAGLRSEDRRRASTSTCSTRPSSFPEEIVPLEVDRQDGARPQPRQLLRRDRAGRVLPATSCPASTSPTIRCCRDASSRTSTRS